MVREAEGGLGALAAIEAELGKVWIHSEAVMLGIRPPRALDPVRETIRDAVAASVRMHRLDDESEWTPHVSVAYSHADGPAKPIVDALALRPEGRPLRVSEVHLVEQTREGRLYRWDVRAVVPLGA